MTKNKLNNYAFIDSQNLNLAILDMGWKLDYQRFRVYLSDKFNVKKAFLFIGYVEKNKSLYKFLKKSNYELIFKPTLKYKKDQKSYTKGNVDAELVLHTMIELPTFDKAIIVSGDGDFYCLIEYLIKNKKFLNLIIPNPNRYSALLRKFRQYFVYIHKLEIKLGQTKKEGSDLRTKP